PPQSDPPAPVREPGPTPPKRMQLRYPRTKVRAFHEGRQGYRMTWRNSRFLRASVAGFEFWKELLDLYQPAGFGDGSGCSGALRSAPLVKVGHLVHAGNGAVRRARFLGQILAADIFHRVLHQRRGGIPALLRTVVHQPLLADVQVAGSGAAAPFVGTPVGNIVLKEVDAGVAALLHGLHLAVDFALLRAQRLQLAVAVVNNADRRGEAEFHGTPAHGQRVFGIADAAAHHGIDVHMKIGVLRQQLQFLVQHLQAFLGNFVGQDVIDGDLQVLQPGAVQPLNAFRGEQIAVGDQAGDYAVPAYAADDV